MAATCGCSVSISSQFDFAAYSAKDWLQVVMPFCITGSTYGAWKAFRYSKARLPSDFSSAAGARRMSMR
jgi:hypothetical protein